MYEPVRTTFLIIFVLGIIWKRSDGYYLDHKPDFSSNSVALHASLTRIRRAPQDYTDDIAKCTTPEQPENGNWTYEDMTLGKAGSEVDEATEIIFSCDHGYKLAGADQPIFCANQDKWSVTEMPYCQRVCKSVDDTEIITYTCKRNNYKVPCNDATDNTIRTFKCAPFYESPPGRPQRSTCYRGEWEFNHECVPECGVKKVPSTPLIVGGKEAIEGNYPWVMILYQYNETSDDYDFICGGSLISLNIVLTAAHCLDKNLTGAINPPELFRVGAGKHYIKFEDPRDKDTAIYSEIEAIMTHPDYKGITQNYRGDIALLKLDREVTLSERVRPVCFIDPPELGENATGWVTGWGFTTPSGIVSNELNELGLPYIAFNDCNKSLNYDFAERFLISDKICAGFSDQNKSVCKGDSGGGLVFENPNYKRRYFVYGVVSLSHTVVENSTRQCNVQRSALFTKVQHYIEWVQLQVRHWDPKFDTSKNCKTPAQPTNGQWTYQDNKVGGANEIVKRQTTILFTCNEGYQLSSTDGIEQLVRCSKNGKWSLTEMPTCQVPSEYPEDTQSPPE